MISEGDYFIVTRSADGESVATPVGTKEGLTDDKFFAVRTADGFRVPCAVSGKPSDGDPFIATRTADAERVATPLGGGGGRGKIDELPFVTFVPRPSTVTVYDNPSEVLFDFDGGGPLGDGNMAFINMYYKDVDGSGDTIPVNVFDPGSRVCSVPGGKYDLEWFDGFFFPGALAMRIHLITEKFNPSTVGWFTQPASTVIKSWRIPQSSNFDRSELHGNFSVLEGDDLMLSGFDPFAVDIYGVAFSFFVFSGGVWPGSSWTLQKPLAPVKIIGWDT
jgi:hypothetical protein